MKKCLFVSLFLFGFGLGLFAQEVTQEQEQSEQSSDYRFYFGYGFSTLITTGDVPFVSFDFAFPLYRNKSTGLGLRNAILFDMGIVQNDGNEYGYYSLSDKIILEHFSPNQLFRYYSFIQGGIGIYGNENKAYFDTPIAYNLSAGLGIDFFVQKNMSVFLDYTVMAHVLDSDKRSLDSKFTIGMRLFF